MHNPPEGRFLVGISPWPRRLAGMLSALALFQVVWFSTLNWKPSWQMALVGVSMVLALIWAFLSIQKPETGALHWDGLTWHWSGFTDGACLLQRHLDFQALILVSLRRPAKRPVWLWLQRSDGPQPWLALRRAVVHSTSPGPTQRARQGVQVSPAATP